MLPTSAGVEPATSWTTTVQRRMCIPLYYTLTPSLAEPGYTLPLQTVYIQISEEEANWYGSALFVIQYVNLYQQPGSSIMIGWKFENGVAS